MNDLAKDLLTRQLDDAERDLDRQIDSIAQRLQDLQRNPANGNWRMFAHDVAESAQIAGRVRALRDAAVFMDQR